MWLTELLALIILVYWIFTLWEYKKYGGTVQSLSEEAAAPAKAADQIGSPALPLVSVIVAAKEEESSIVQTVRHLLTQTYPRLEIIAVNDRSADRTGSRLDELKRWAERDGHFPVPLKVVHVANLPQGWLGKNHALYQGYCEARGQLLLFTDADVKFEPDAIQSAVRFMQKEEADHLTASPAILANGFWLRAFVHYFLSSLNLFIKPWRANDDRSFKYGTGIGAFNLVTRKAYEAIGTHRAFAMRPDDDLKLGALIKSSGFRQRLAMAKTLLEVEWYTDLPSAFRGLEKNFFSGFQYRLWLAGAALCGQLLMFLYPFVGVWFSASWAAAAHGASIVILCALYIATVRSVTGGDAREVFVLPFSVLLLAYALTRAVFLTLKRGGVYWRGTFYRLRDLKKMD